MRTQGARNVAIVGLMLLGWLAAGAEASENPSDADGARAVGGQEGQRPVSSLEIEQTPLYVHHAGGARRVIRLRFEGGPDFEGGVVDVCALGKVERTRIAGASGACGVEVPLPDVEIDETTVVTATLEADGTRLHALARVEPARQWEVHFLPHSHLDIGYTHTQKEVEQIQWSYFRKARMIAERTKDYPEGSRFIWNVEGLWSVERFLKAADPAQRDEFLDSVKKGYLALTGTNGSFLSGICRPEELYEHVDGVHLMREKYGIDIDTAMITDVPGYSWGIVPTMAQSGIKYLSLGVNHMPNLPHKGDRIGYTLEAWGDQPFYWVSPSGDERLLFWMSSKGYSWFHNWIMDKLSKCGMDPILQYLGELDASEYPYELVKLRYTIGADNGPPDPEMPDIVREWNARYAYPRIVINSTSGFMREFERRYGDELPEYGGDFTPYWEDGTVSSARETALNREAAELLVQAAALWSMTSPRDIPKERFADAWDNVILYSEHTWGTHESISRPDSDFTRETWRVKAAMATDAHRQSLDLAAEALAGLEGHGDTVEAFQVVNTCSWPRSELVLLPSDWKLKGERVLDEKGRPVPSQRLSTGELAVLVKGIRPLGSSGFTLTEGAPLKEGKARAEGNRLSNGVLSLGVDPGTGAIESLSHGAFGAEFVDSAGGQGLNGYFYLPGADPANVQGVQGGVNVAVRDEGPLVASLLVVSGAPGCESLTREIRVVDGLDYVELVNTVDKTDIREKESAHFAFPFGVDHGQVRMDLAWGAMRPELDQLRGANKNYYSIQRWVDVSGPEAGVTLATVDAPLVELGGPVAETWNLDPTRPWVKVASTSRNVYSYVMNNYWHTNYKASQGGVTVFRYALRPHGAFDAASAKRFGIERSQPLMTVQVKPGTPVMDTLFDVSNEDVIVTSLKPSRDGDALMVRLFNATDKASKYSVKCLGDKVKRFRLSSPMEERGDKSASAGELGPWEIVTLRCE